MMTQAGGAGPADLATGPAGSTLPAAGGPGTTLTEGSGSDLYDSVTGFAIDTPSWLQGLGSAYTKAGLLLFGVLFVVAWWRARSTGEPRAVALALLAPGVTAAAYLLSELSKSFIHEDRPCRGLDAAAIIVDCPEVGDWSFPSNHSTIAAAAAIGLALAWRRSTPWVVAMAALMAFSRVFVGAHYPHDVLAGLALGAVVAWALVRLLAGPATALVIRYTGHPLLGRALTGAPAPAGAAADAPREPAAEALTQPLPRQRRAPGPPPVRPEPGRTPASGPGWPSTEGPTRRLPRPSRPQDPRRHR